MSRLEEQAQLVPQLRIAPIEVGESLRNLAYDSIKAAITQTDIYGHTEEVRLDERRLGQDLGVSRTPIREAMSLLEQEGFVRSVPRRGAFVVRKTKAEIIEMILVWAALESMAARLAATRASDDELAALRAMFAAFEEDPSAHVHEYSAANIAFHQTIIRLGACALIVDMTQNLFIHMRAIRNVSMRQENRALRSHGEHTGIIDALARRDADEAERLVREHALGLADHVEKHGVFPA